MWFRAWCGGSTRTEESLQMRDAHPRSPTRPLRLKEDRNGSPVQGNVLHVGGMISEGAMMNIAENMSEAGSGTSIHRLTLVALPGRAALLVVAVAALTVGAASPSMAADPIDDLSTLEVIESATPGTENAEVLAVQESANTADYFADIPERDTVITIPGDASAGVALDQGGDVVTVGLPNASEAARGIADADGLVHFNNADGSTTVPLVREDGVVQITTIIETASAPAVFEYPIAVADGGQLVDAGDGFFAVLDEAGQPAAMIDPAWAKDANGRDVPTWYEQQGNTLVQVVEHRSDFAYPVVADPAVRGNLITDVKLSWSRYGTTVGVTPRSGWAITPFSNWWAEYKLWVSAQYEGNKFYNQLRCHVDIAPFKSPWNLDAWRPDVRYSDVLAAGCNP